MPRFFINRPIFAWVIAIMIMLAGLLSIRTLPVSQYPPIAPPQITINAMYPGASAQTVQDTVTQVIEQKLNGIDNLLYMSSSSDSSGAAAINLTFKAGTDPNIAQVQVQNKLQLATPLAAPGGATAGNLRRQIHRNFLLVVGLVSEDGSMDRNALTDYLVSNVQDIVSRLEGVGEMQVFGSQNAMRIWLNPARLNNYHLTTNDVIAALQAQNAQVSAGQFGGTPATHGQQLNATITTRTLMQTPEQFEAVILRTNSDGSTVKLKDVAECKIGTENYDIQSFYKGKPVGAMAIRLASGANALETATRIKAKMEELSRYFPQGIKVVYPFDSTPFVKISIEEVVKTLIEAIILVFIIMFLFLQNFRATLIPTIAVPVVLLGTFGGSVSLRVFHQHAHHVRPGHRHRPAGGRRHRGGGERGADHDRGGASAQGGHHQIDGTDHQRAVGHRHRSNGGVRADGLFRRLHRGHLPAVFHHDHLPP